MALNIDDVFIVTRSRKNWFYGYKPEAPKVRGFAPKAALSSNCTSDEDEALKKTE